MVGCALILIIIHPIHTVWGARCWASYGVTVELWCSPTISKCAKEKYYSRCMKKPPISVLRNKEQIGVPSFSPEIHQARVRKNSMPSTTLPIDLDLGPLSVGVL